MTTVVPVAIADPALPLADPADRATFTARKLEHLRWEKEVLSPGAKALADASYANALDAQGSATAASGSASSASSYASTAITQAGLAAGSAASALSAPGTSATSTTSMTVGTGSKAFTLAQTGKAFVVGQWVSVTDSATPTTNWMLGAIASFTPGTGAITVTVIASQGSLTGTSWVVSGSAPPGYGGAATFTTVTANSFTPNSATVPTNGMYLPGTNSIGWATNGSNRLTLGATGDLTATGNIGQTSDERLKTNWRDLPTDFTVKLSIVKCGVYDRLDEPITQVGVSAQSLLKVMPDAVLLNEDGFLSVNYGQAALVACIQLAKEVESLKLALAALK